ncbi:molybdopterin-dependent oxidoreductase [Kribbella deserti]|uniref:Molybdopterin-dependent oxidoreductase n=1 Tax=Kribbella deserti TaxID=1926257 RepID=A0ABV6QG28_9ACTN
MATVLGRWLGIAVLICFLTGLLSHWQQETPAWLTIPSRPASLYRVTQGLHVLSGLVSVPLLLAKLWTVYPKLFAKLPWPPSRRAFAELLERLSIAILVAALALEVFIGFLNTLQWYPWPFPFRETHYALAWVIVGALLIHLAVKLPLILAHWTRPLPSSESASLPEATGGMSRRTLFRTVAGAGALVAITAAGQSVPALAPIAVLAPRRPGVGPQGLPVNRTASDAGVVAQALSDEWRLTVVGPRELTFSLEQLRALPQSRADLPIACVEGWSQSARWEGIRVRDLLRLCGAGDTARVRVVSLERDGFYGTSELPPQFAADPLTLLALRVNGENLDLDHGFPARIIAPNRPGVLQTKWVHRLELL